MTESNQSTDERVIYAREFLAGARRRPVAEMPPSVLIREAAELRRVLGQVLDVVVDYEATEIDENVTRILDSGGARVAPAGVLVLHTALSDAVAWCEDNAHCDDCETSQSGLCETHGARLTASARTGWPPVQLTGAGSYSAGARPRPPATGAPR